MVAEETQKLNNGMKKLSAPQTARMIYDSLRISARLNATYGERVFANVHWYGDSQMVRTYLKRTSKVFDDLEYGDKSRLDVVVAHGRQEDGHQGPDTAE